MIAIADYGMGNRRSVEKALEHVGAPSLITSDADELRRADGVILPGVGAFPEAMRNVTRLGMDEVLRERAAAGAPLLGVCLGLQLLFERSSEHEGAAGLGLLPGEVTPLAGPKLPHIGWNLVTFERDSVLTEGLGPAAAFYHVHSFACRPSEPGDVVGRGEYGERFVSIAERGSVYGVQFHPEKSSRDGLALLANFARVCARVGGVILYPAIDILDGKAVRLVQGRFEDQTVYNDDPLEAAQSWVDGGARFLHVVDLDGARTGSPQSIEHLRRICRGTGVPVQYGGGLRSLPAVRDALRAGAERAVVGTAAFRDVDFLDEILRAFGPRIVVSVDVRHGMISTSGWTQTTQMPAADAIRRLGDRGVNSFVYTNVDRDGKLEGPDLDEVARVAEAVRGRFLYSGGIGRADDLRALAELRQVNLAGVIVGKALYEGRFTIPEGQAALDLV